MASTAYYEWVRQGRPLEPCQPVREVVERMRRAFPLAAQQAQFSWYADEDHYEAEPPLDHTPFSATGWPLPSPRWVVFATDIMHRPDLGVDCHVLFGYWIAEARAGRMPWLKYLIWQGKSYHARGSFLVAEDEDGHYDHIHLSFRTDHRYTQLGSWSPTPGRIEPMRTALVTANGDPTKTVWLSNGILRVPVGNYDDTDRTTDDETVKRDTKWVSGNVLGTLLNTTVHAVDNLDSYGMAMPKDFADAFAAMAAKVAALGTPPPATVDADALEAVLLRPKVLAAIAKAVVDEDHKRSAS